MRSEGRPRPTRPPGRRRLHGRLSGPTRLPPDAADGPGRPSRQPGDPFPRNARRQQQLDITTPRITVHRFLPFAQSALGFPRVRGYPGTPKLGSSEPDMNSRILADRILGTVRCRRSYVESHFSTRLLHAHATKGYESMPWLDTRRTVISARMVLDGGFGASPSRSGRLGVIPAKRIDIDPISRIRPGRQLPRKGRYPVAGTL